MTLKRHLFIAVMLPGLLLVCQPIFRGQAQSQYDKGTPPQFVAGVSSFGSYASADMGAVNLSNGALNLKIPLVNVGGRGLSLPITLNWSSKIWSASIDYDEEPGCGRGGCDDPNPSMVPLAYADYANADNYVGLEWRAEAGWTVGGMPFMLQRVVRINYTNIQPRGPCYDFTLPKLTFMMPDRGEVEFRDDAYDGAPLSSDCGGWIAGLSRGRRWHATDGSGTIYITDVDNGAAGPFPNLTGVVITADGTRFYLNAAGGCYLIMDRHGNKISFSGNEIVDPLGRTTTIQSNAPDPDNPSQTLAVLVTVKGYGGQPRYYKVKSGIMNQHYRSDLNPSLPVITGSYDPMSWGYSNWWPASTTILFPLSYGLFAQRIDNRPVICELTLPDQRSLRFNYNEFGEVAEVQMPTGGKVWYDYGSELSFPSGNSPMWETGGDYHTSVPEVDRGVIQRRTFPDGSTLEGTWNYSYIGSSTLITASAAGGALLLNEAHYYLPAGRYTESIVGGHNGTHYNLWSTGVEWRTEIRNATDTVLTANEQDWTQRTPVSWSTYTQEQPANDNRVNQTRRYLENGNFAKTESSYDDLNYPRANNVSEVREYDFDGSLKRRSTTIYVTGSYQNDDSIHLLGLSLVQTVFDANGNQVAQATNEYDNYSGDGNHAPLQDYGAVIGHDINYGSALTARGNLTAAGHWLNTNNSIIYSFPRYDILGNVVGTKDAKGNITELSYADDFGNGSNPGGGASGAYGPTYALPTLITSSPPQVGQPPQTARSEYDFSTGLLTGFKDRNGTVTQTIYNDPFDRPTLVKTALGSGVESHAAMYYAPTTVFGISLTNSDVLAAKDQTNIDDAVLRSWTKTDGFGRTVEAWSKDPQGDVKLQTVYDALSRAKQVSNPYRPSLSETPVYTTTVYDLAGRVISVTTPDSAAVTTSYSGNTVTVTDQAGKQRKSVTDALGRLVQVYEDPAGLNYLTSYSYDTLDDLTAVNQGSQTRTFVYDSLKRLTSATNPESGTVSYQYDPNGNLIQKTDARSITTNYVYDALNRVTSRSYNDSTPGVTYAYDSTTIANGKGRLASVSSSVSSYSYSGYDSMGRSLGGTQTIGAQTYSMSYTYDFAGHVKTMTYPSGRSIANTFDGVGRLGSFAGNLGDGVQRTYANGITYSPFGGMTREQYGTTTPLYNKTLYNVRGQMFDRRVSSVNDTWDWNRGRLIWYYSSNHVWGGSGTDNNGNVVYAENWLPPPNATLDQAQYLFADTYTYDSLNRLSAVNESSLDIANGGSWQSQFAQVYNFDRYGNRRIDQASTWGTGVPKPNFGMDANTNRLSAPAGYGMSYDAAGNLTNDTYMGEGARTYDAENRMKQAWANNQWQTYSYDGDGRRIKRNVNGAETWEVYGLGGELLAEYSANAAATSPQKEYGYRNGELLITAEASTGGARTNFALASNGSTATASSTYPGYGFTPAAAIDGEHKGLNWLSGGGWHGGNNSFPQWLQVDFNGSKTIDEVDVYTLQDDYANPIEPTEATTFSVYGLTGFDVQYWNGSAWVTVPGGSVSGNNKVWKKISFSAITTTKIRVLTNGSVDGWSRIPEVEAWTATSAGNSAQIHWLVTDQLGTPRMVFDQTGSLANVSRHDYLPFGEEIFAGTGGRTTAQGYSASDNVRQKFTQKERDNETGLDYSIHRYYSPAQGRFTSSDEPFADQSANDPQSWNLYAYVRNNPLRSTDPDGRSDLWEKLKNAILWGCRCTNAELEQRRQADENQRRRELEQYSASRGLGGYIIVGEPGAQAAAVSVASLSRDQVMRYSQILRNVEAGINDPNVVTIRHDDALSLISGVVGNLPNRIGGRIADGHAWEKHQSEFPGWNKGQFAQKIDETIQGATGSNVKNLSNGRTAYWNEQEKMVVIRDTKSPDGGTAFRPTNGRAYFENLR
ncbi:MAG TPA: RHS repeat-associated core domain-containing protein [Pyrinomonadaceae bacterium]